MIEAYVFSITPSSKSVYLILSGYSTLQLHNYNGVRYIGELLSCDFGFPLTYFSI